MISHDQGHVTVTYQVTREFHGVDLCLDNLVEQKQVINQKNIIDLTCTHRERTGDIIMSC